MDYIAALTAFVEAAEHGNFTRAAERLGIKASTVSRYIGDLETDLGIALFNRSTRALKLTEGGCTLLVHSKKILEDLEHARSETSSLNDEPRGLLKLNAPPAFARYHIVPALGEFRRKYPEIRLELKCDERQVNLIEEGADLAIRLGHLVDSSLKARKIADEHWVLCAAPSLASRLLDVKHPAGLVDVGFISGKSVIEPTWHRNNEVFSKQHAVQLKINDPEAQLVAAEMGLGIVMLPTWLAGTAIKTGRLVRLLEEWDCMSGNLIESIWFIYPPKRIVSSKVRSFIDFMVERVGTPPYWRD